MSLAVKPSAHRRVLVIHNPAAGWRRAARFGRILNALVAAGCVVEVMRTAKRGDAEEIAGKVHVRDWDVLAVAGGDGTINEVVNGMGEDSPPLAILPLGSANVAAREIGMPRDPVAIARVVAGGRTEEVFVGVANGRRFLAMAGVGFDALVVEALNPALKRWVGRGAYAFETARRLCLFTDRRYAVTLDGRTYEAASVVLAKGHYYGGGFTCAPGARLDDPRLHVCLFTRSGRLAAVRYIAGLLFGLLPRMRDVVVIPARQVGVEVGAADPVQGDGDIITRLPLAAGIDLRPIRVVTAGSGLSACAQNPGATPPHRPC